MTFADLGLSDELLRAVDDSGYPEPTPIQRAAIPSVLSKRFDGFGCRPHVSRRRFASYPLSSAPRKAGTTYLASVHFCPASVGNMRLRF